MPIYELTSRTIRPINETTFATAGISERGDLQRLLRAQIEVISADTLILSEEFGEWEDSRRRIDLLGLDKDANLVIIELKRTEYGGHMELQAIRYAAMVSTMTFEDAASVYARYLEKRGRTDDARESILEFLAWDGPDDDEFAQDVRIILASAEFSKELTTAAIWLNQRELDVRCIRLKPYQDGDRLLLDVQQIVPLPEASEYQVRYKQKQGRERASRQSKRDLTRYDVTANGRIHENLTKRAAIYTVIRHLCDLGHSPEKIAEVIHWRKNRVFRSAGGNLNEREFLIRMREIEAQGGGRFAERRFFCDDEQLIHANGKTYAVSNQWGARTAEAMEKLVQAFPEAGVAYQEAGT